LTTVESTRLYRQIAEQIAALIDRGEFLPGARLPAERELATLLGVSRTSVREAIICLELAGRVEVRVGTGIFVARTRPVAVSPAASDDDLPGPFDLLAARRMIEGEIAALAARSIRRPQLDTLRETMDRMRANGADPAERDAADREFHTTIALAAGNGALVAVVQRLWDVRAHPMWTRFEKHFHTPELRARTIDDHAAIVAALALHQPEAARIAMHRHLARVAREFQRQWDGRDEPQAASATRRR
jgi:DNA-binding FadR family transcriptional regulator